MALDATDSPFRDDDSIDALTGALRSLEARVEKLEAGLQTGAYNAEEMPYSVEIWMPLPDVRLTKNGRKSLNFRRFGASLVRQLEATHKQRAVESAEEVRKEEGNGIWDVTFPCNITVDITWYLGKFKRILDQDGAMAALAPYWDGFEEAGLYLNDRQLRFNPIIFVRDKTNYPDGALHIVLSARWSQTA